MSVLDFLLYSLTSKYVMHCICNAAMFAHCDVHKSRSVTFIEFDILNFWFKGVVGGCPKFSLVKSCSRGFLMVTAGWLNGRASAGLRSC